MIGLLGVQHLSEQLYRDTNAGIGNCAFAIYRKRISTTQRVTILPGKELGKWTASGRVLHTLNVKEGLYVTDVGQV